MEKVLALPLGDTPPIVTGALDMGYGVDRIMCKPWGSDAMLIPVCASSKRG